MIRFAVLVFFLSISHIFAQQGDKKGEQQVLRVPREKIRPAPALSPQDALKTFTLQGDFRIELVASEPMVEEPVALSFDEHGRMWVVEMRGFMPDAEGTGEREIPGRVSILEDTDADGVMDKKTVFLDNLILPRAITCVRGGALIAEPPKLWFCPDRDRDGKADGKIEVASDYGDPKNPEHSANGLLLARDNWIYSLYHGYRYRFADGKWMREANPTRAQWGLTQDDLGRLFYTANSDHLRADLLPGHYLANKPPGAKMPGFGHKVAANQTVWPGRVNPGVNRGYLPTTLKPDGRLDKFTAACGTVIYRGDLFPREFYGNAFVCEPAGNFIRRSILTEKDGMISATNAYHQKEFLTSTDERFRPVNLYNAPDGALYVVDMYHGILQHRIYLTTYLRQQIEERGLNRPVHVGRIYRIVPVKRPVPVRLASADTRRLVEFLEHPNGWVRDTAQRLLVERQDSNAIKLLRSVKSDSARLHALWTLEGLGVKDRAYLKDADPNIRAAAIRILDADEKPGNERAAAPQIQLALSLKSKDALRKLASTSPYALARDAAKFTLGEYEVAARKSKPVKVIPLTAEERQQFDVGKAVYETACVPCHQPNGHGQDGLAPPLVQSEWVAGPPERLVRIILHGLRGPIKVKGATYELDMPALGVLDDAQIAGVLTYIRREWNHGFSPVSPMLVKKVRDGTAAREDAWTEPELLKIK